MSMLVDSFRLGLVYVDSFSTYLTKPNPLCISLFYYSYFYLLCLIHFGILRISLMNLKIRNIILTVLCEL